MKKIDALTGARFFAIMLIINTHFEFLMKLNGKYRFRLIIKFKNSPEFREMMTRLLRELCNNRKYSEVTAYMDVDPDNII